MTSNARPTVYQTASHSLDIEGIEARFGVRIASLLGEQAARTDANIAERLRFARERALERAREVRREVAAAPATTVVGRGPAAVLARRTGWWVKFASAMPLAMLVFGLVVIDRLHDHAQIAAAAEVDAALLSDDLPPSAYTDPGFAEYLQQSGEE